MQFSSLSGTAIPESRLKDLCAYLDHYAQQMNVCISLSISYHEITFCVNERKTFVVLIKL